MKFPIDDDMIGTGLSYYNKQNISEVAPTNEEGIDFSNISIEVAQNNNLKPVHLPMKLKFGQEPRTDFFNNLNTEQFTKIRKFFDEMPKLRHEVEVENPKTKVKSTVTFSGLADFFVSASPTAT